MPRRSRVDRRGSVLRGDGVTLPHADVPRDGPERHGKAPGASKTITEPSGGAERALAALWCSMTEREFQQHAVDGLTQRGYLVWHVVDSRLMAAGLPDIIAVHPTRIPRRVHFWELKTMSGLATVKQREALAALGDVYGVDARIVRPDDWVAILEDLDR